MSVHATALNEVSYNARQQRSLNSWVLECIVSFLHHTGNTLPLTGFCFCVCVWFSWHEVRETHRDLTSHGDSFLCLDFCCQSARRKPTWSPEMIPWHTYTFSALSKNAPYLPQEMHGWASWFSSWGVSHAWLMVRLIFLTESSLALWRGGARSHSHPLRSPLISALSWQTWTLLRAAYFICCPFQWHLHGPVVQKLFVFAGIPYESDPPFNLNKHTHCIVLCF